MLLKQGVRDLLDEQDHRKQTHAERLSDEMRQLRFGLAMMVQAARNHVARSQRRKRANRG
jgi:hypothetical protein